AVLQAAGQGDHAFFLAVLLQKTLGILQVGGLEIAYLLLYVRGGKLIVARDGSVDLILGQLQALCVINVPDPKQKKLEVQRREIGLKVSGGIDANRVTDAIGLGGE